MATLGTLACVSPYTLLASSKESDSADPVLAGRPLVRYPEKTDLILLTSRPPQLETPKRYFDRAITPNEAFFVRYHIFPPTNVDLATLRLKIGGLVERPMELSLYDLKTKFSRTSIVAVNQCSGNGRGHLTPRVFGGQWGDGAMGNAEWTGAPLREILNQAIAKPTGAQVTFKGLDKPSAPTIPEFVKSLSTGRALDDPNVIVAYEMNGQPLPMLNGFPARLVVPGWYSTYWVKNLSEITIIDKEFDGFFMKTAYRIPDTPCGCIEPGTQATRTVPISRMVVKSVIATPANGAQVSRGQSVTLNGVAFDGGYGIAEVLASTDGGETWQSARLGQHLGPYSFREWTYTWKPLQAGESRALVRAINRVGESQPLQPLWNASGYLLNAVDKVDLQVG
jgi:DMSO/TMAO reductase YedYZ molybdopterin-dependent catalytic subunit